ncbi:adenylate/guanylate cyclase domain-containing protein [Microvirga guangxiensis]|uniref:TolB amino-terminal domain-containing protein n=1 Tax=Microvirga guangxiensis TaxID=549386 RepID=A0A1G5LJ09_9HYPH|nr:adenylate/guanylate cyclase domain-containing protein [Microvirga guangxiensis]SCZ12614.1 TolB amino-terminal domain-containing protein [Microvirga guangxiensis]
MDEPDRRLLAIVCADIAGYSRLMSEDEDGTFILLRNLLADVVNPSAASHHGRIVKTMGDGFLAEFGSTVQAVGFAVEVQRRCKEVGSPLCFRIGIHVGDVIATEGDVFGDGVNIAARLQEAADPGGILVSRQVRDHARDRFPFEEAGERRFKNIQRPVRTFRIVGKLEPPRKPSLARFLKGHLLPIGLVVAALVTLALLTFLLASPSKWRPEPHGGRPTIAALPFTNRSGDPAQDYFSDGLTENVLTALARFPHLFVVSRNSTFSYKGKPIDLTEVGRTLGVRYALEGSVQKSGDQIRVAAQLSDTLSGAQIWAERYDRPLQDIFAIQDEIAERIAARLGATIQRAEVAAGLRKPTTDLTAYDYYLRGRSLRQTNRRDKAIEARALFGKAVKLDPLFAPAIAELAFSDYREVALRWDPPNRDKVLARGLSYAERALAVDPALPLAHMVMGDLLLRRLSHDEAIRWAQRAVELNPSEAEYHAGLANILTFAGRIKEAAFLMRRAFVLDPLHPPNYDMYLARALLLDRRFDEALPHLRDCARRVPDYWPCHLFSAVAYAHLDRGAEARSAVEDLRKNSTVRSVNGFLGTGEYLPGPHRDLIQEGLARAGLPVD